MVYILFIPIGRPAVFLCLKLGKLNGVCFGIPAIFTDRPWNVPIPIVISLKSKLNPVHIHRALYFGCLKNAF